MFKLLFYLNVILNIKCNDGKTFERGRLNDNSLKDEAPWPNLWFPFPPNYQNDVKPVIATVAPVENPNKDLFDKSNTTGWPGLWFPHPPNNQNDIKPEIETMAPVENPIKDKSNTTDWPGLWFPYPQNYHDDGAVKGSTVKKFECDNQHNISVDFDPQNNGHSFNYLCIGNRTEYAPNVNTSALLKEYVIPAAYEPPVKCLNESIEYTELFPPTFGAYRPFPPKFGTYQYLPPQRWLHSLHDGAIVFLYHPCAFAGQIKQLQNTLRGCLYRHIITPSQLLTPQYPLTLLAWGKSLQMSVMDDTIVVNFIKSNAKMGFRQKKQKLKMSSTLYDAALLNEAHLVTDDQDKEICGYKEMR